MKAFRIGNGEQAKHFYTVTALRKYLKAHPEIQEVVREHWYYGDLEERDMTRDEILNTKVRKITKGQTAQWAQSHHAPCPLKPAGSKTSGSGTTGSPAKGVVQMIPAFMVEIPVDDAPDA